MSWLALIPNPLVCFVVVALYVCAFCWHEHRKDKNQQIAGVQRTLTPFPAYLLRVFLYLSYPLGAVLAWFIKDKDKAVSRRRIERWIFSWLLLNMAILAWGIRDTVALMLLPTLRLFDILHTLFSLLLFRKREAHRARSLGLLMVHLFEVTVVFACAYLAVQTWSQRKLFLVKGCLSSLGSATALHFSLITSATVGYGDIVPVTDGSWSALVIQLLITAEILTSLFIILISIPRALGISDEFEWNAKKKEFEPTDPNSE